MTEQMLAPNGEMMEKMDAIEAWSTLADILQDRLNCQVNGFNPGFLISRQGETKACEMPTWLSLEIAAWPNPRFVAEGYMVVVNGEKTYFKTYVEANSNCDGDQKPAILYDILQKPTQTG